MCYATDWPHDILQLGLLTFGSSAITGRWWLSDKIEKRAMLLYGLSIPDFSNFTTQ